MAKRRKSYRAYVNTERKINSELRHAVSELRHGRAGCQFAKENIRNAKALYAAGGSARQATRINRVIRVLLKKCGSRPSFV